MEYAIRIEALAKRYPLFQLEDISFDVPGGAIVGLIGENGAGKSTTLKCILGLIRRDGGTVTVLGRDAAGPDRDVREEVGVVLDECPFHATLTADALGRVLSGIYRHWDEDLYQKLLRDYELPRNLYLKEFSKGMKMKLSIAAALAHHPRLLVLDEPTSGLDPVVRDEILDAFRGFVRDEDHAVLLSSHITSDLEKAADYIVYLHHGRVVFAREKDRLLDSYGRLACSQADLERVDPALLAGVRHNQFGCEALVTDRAAFARRYPDLGVDRVTLDDIMVLTVKGEDAE